MVFLWMILSILTGVLAITSVVFAIVAFANGTRNKFTWLIVFLCSLVCMIVFLILTVRGFVKTVKNVAYDLETSMYKSIEKTAYNDYHFADSTNSEQIRLLQLIAPEDLKASIPGQFYNYLGYLDYYRMPLRYPYALHCNDVLDNASLFNESAVTSYNLNDNGEKDCHINYISEFDFDENILIIRQRQENDLKKFNYLIYHFDTGEKEEFTDLDHLKKRAGELQFSRKIKFYNCSQYFDLLK